MPHCSRRPTDSCEAHVKRALGTEVRERSGRDKPGPVAGVPRCHPLEAAYTGRFCWVPLQTPRYDEHVTPHGVGCVPQRFSFSFTVRLALLEKQWVASVAPTSSLAATFPSCLSTLAARLRVFPLSFSFSVVVSPAASQTLGDFSFNAAVPAAEADPLLRLILSRPLARALHSLPQVALTFTAFRSRWVFLPLRVSSGGPGGSGATHSSRVCTGLAVPSALRRVAWIAPSSPQATVARSWESTASRGEVALGAGTKSVWTTPGGSSAPRRTALVILSPDPSSELPHATVGRSWESTTTCSPISEWNGARVRTSPGAPSAPRRTDWTPSIASHTTVARPWESTATSGSDPLGGESARTGPGAPSAPKRTDFTPPGVHQTTVARSWESIASSGPLPSAESVCTFPGLPSAPRRTNWIPWGPVQTTVARSWESIARSGSVPGAAASVWTPPCGVPSAPRRTDRIPSGPAHTTVARSWESVATGGPTPSSGLGIMQKGPGAHASGGAA